MEKRGREKGRVEEQRARKKVVCACVCVCVCVSKRSPPYTEQRLTMLHPHTSNIGRPDPNPGFAAGVCRIP